jgi:uncharacterized protein involved in exopolysaccharide biosynthesis
MNKRVVRRLLETFFRRWYLYLLPLVLFFGVGVWKASGTTSGYRSVGIVDVSNGTLLSELTSIRGENYGWETPAASTARTINSLLGTGQFVESIAESAGVTGAIERGELTLFGVRQSINATAGGDNLLNVVATTASPELSARLVTATIDGFVDYVVARDVSESRAAEAFFENQVETYVTALQAAEGALRTYVDTHPGGPIEERPLQEQIEIGRLESAVEQAQSKVTAAQEKTGEARLATEQATEDVRQRLRVIDEPEAAVAPEPRLKNAVSTVMVFTLVGLLLSFGAVVLATFVDRSLWSVEDIEHAFKLPALAVIPDARHKRRSPAAERSEFTTLATPAVRATPAAVENGPTTMTVTASPKRSASRPPPAKPARSRRPAPAQNEPTP